jgi:hypothetical protein
MARMAWRMTRLAAVLALGGVACGRTELLVLATDAETGNDSTSGGLDGFDTGGLDTGRPTSGLDTGGPITVTDTFTTGFDTGVFDTGVLDTGFPVTTGVTTEIDETGFPVTTSGVETSTSGGMETDGETTSGGSTDGGTTSGGTTDGGTTSVGTTDGETTGGGTTDGGTTSGGTTAGSTTDGGTTSVGTTDGETTDGGGTTDGGTTDGETTGGDLTCLDAVDCVLACGGASFSCIGQCNDGLSPQDNAAFNDLETCIIFACVVNGSCGFDFDEPDCVACRVDGQLDPAPLACDDEAAACT